MPPSGWYYRLSRFFKDKFGEKVFKIPVDAGFTCPNRDGTIATQGCIFCYNPSFSPAVLRNEGREARNEERGTRSEKWGTGNEGRGARDEELGNGKKEVQVGPIREQLLHFQINAEKRKIGDEQKNTATSIAEFKPQRKYLAYFQAYSNTYAPLATLQKLYEEALETPGIIGLSIATRPDCLNEEVLELLATYAQDFHIWLELGLQTAHDHTLTLINRGHTYAQFEQAVLASSNRGIYICAHIINGLPGESRQEMLTTVHRLNQLPLHGIKFHQLQVLHKTALAKLYSQGKVEAMTLNYYLNVLCDQLGILRPDIAVHRLLSEVTDSKLLIAPHWQVSRASFARMVEKELQLRNSYQGSRA